MSQLESIKDVNFFNLNYDELVIPDGSIVYCDPPYKGTKEYDVKNKLNHEMFWEWCRNTSKKNKVFISEYNAPDDFECVWQKDVNVSIRPDKTLQQVEKLFTIKK